MEDQTEKLEKIKVDHAEIAADLQKVRNNEIKVLKADIETEKGEIEKLHSQTQGKFEALKQKFEDTITELSGDMKMITSVKMFLKEIKSE